MIKANYDLWVEGVGFDVDGVWINGHLMEPRKKEGNIYDMIFKWYTVDDRPDFEYYISKEIVHYPQKRYGFAVVSGHQGGLKTYMRIGGSKTMKGALKLIAQHGGEQ